MKFKKTEPNALGFFCGVFAMRGKKYRVDIMPPEQHWRGNVKGTGNLGPHPTDWVIYIDGEELARVQQRTDIIPAITQKISNTR